MSTETVDAIEKLRWLIGNRRDMAEVMVHVADLRAVLAEIDHLRGGEVRTEYGVRNGDGYKTAGSTDDERQVRAWAKRWRHELFRREVRTSPWRPA